MAAGDEQVRQRAGDEEAIGVLRDASVTHLGEAEHALDDADRVLDARTNSGACTVDPASLLLVGSPDEAGQYCRTLIEKVGKGGGFILDGAAGIPNEAKPENVLAMARSVHKYAP